MNTDALWKNIMADLGRIRSIEDRAISDLFQQLHEEPSLLSAEGRSPMECEFGGGEICLLAVDGEADREYCIAAYIGSNGHPWRGIAGETWHLDDFRYTIKVLAVTN